MNWGRLKLIVYTAGCNTLISKNNVCVRHATAVAVYANATPGFAATPTEGRPGSPRWSVLP